MKRIAILGGSRFIGCHLVKALQRKEYKITIFNRGITSPPEPFHEGITHVTGNRNNHEDLQKVFCKYFDVVFDLSGYTVHHVEPIITHYHHSFGQYIFCSTSSVYKLPISCPLNENSPIDFQKNTYGGDKALVEELLLKEYSNKQLPITIFRPQGVFGPYDAHQAGFIVFRLINSFPVVVNPEKNFKINFLYIKDLIKAFLLAMDNPNAYGKVYGIAGDDIISQLHFIKMCGDIVSRKPILKFSDCSFHFGQKIDVPWLEYDIITDNNKIKKELDLNFTPLYIALSKTIAWLVNNPQHTGSRLLRGELHFIEDRRISKFVRIYWKVIDKLELKRRLRNNKLVLFLLAVKKCIY